MTKALCDESHVARYCPFSRLKDGRPEPAAFELRNDESFLSSNWIEYFGMSDLENGMKKVRDEFQKHHSMTKKGRFAVLNVGDAKKTIEIEHGTELRIEDLQEEDYPSHAGIWFLQEDNLVISTILSEMVRPHNIHPGTNGK